MAGQRTTIYANDYNIIQSMLSQVLGTGSGDFGYGQSVTSTQTVAKTAVSASLWNNLRTDLIKARQHQTGADESGNLIEFTRTTKITEAARASYFSMATLVTTDRLVIPPSNQAARDSISTGVRTTSWNSTVTHSVTVNFSSENAARYFFNTGSSIDISASRIGGSVSTKNSSWTTLLENMGTISLHRSTSTVTGSGTISSSIGWANLTSVNQLIFQKLTETPTYSPNQYDIYAKRGVNSSQMILTIDFKDLSVDTIDENIDGTLTSTVQVYKAAGINVSTPSPVVVSTITGGTLDPIYNVTPNILTVNEGATVIFTVTTTDVPDNTTLYWTSPGTSTAADFTDNLVSGTVNILNNIGTITRQIKSDNLTEGSQTFSIELRTGSSAGPIKATSASVIINDTSIETYSIIPNLTSVNEGGTVIFNVTTAGVINGTTLYWSTTGSTIAADFTNNLVSGTVNILNNIGTITRQIKSDNLTEGSQTFSIELRTGSSAGPIKATSASVIINDTSIETYSIIPNLTLVNEGGTVIFNVTTVGVINGTTLYWSTTGSTIAADFSPATLFGTIVINANTATITRQIKSDNLTEGSQTFSIELRTGSSAGPIKATSASVIINDTAIETYSISPNKTTMKMGDTVTFSIATQGVTGILYWGLLGTASASRSASGTSGSVTIAGSLSAGIGSVSITVATDAATHNSEYFYMRLYKDAARTTAFGSASANVTISANGSQLFTSYTLWTVPAGVTQISTIIYGARGGSGSYDDTKAGIAGFYGSKVTGSFSTTGGTQYHLCIGSAGSNGWSGSGTGGGAGGAFLTDADGGKGGNAGPAGGSGGGGGGGSPSGIFTGTIPNLTPIAVAGGGGGGAGAGYAGGNGPQVTGYSTGHAGAAGTNAPNDGGGGGGGGGGYPVGGAGGGIAGGDGTGTSGNTGQSMVPAGGTLFTQYTITASAGTIIPLTPSTTINVTAGASNIRIGHTGIYKNTLSATTTTFTIVGGNGSTWTMDKALVIGAFTISGGESVLMTPLQPPSVYLAWS